MTTPDPRATFAVLPRAAFLALPLLGCASTPAGAPATRTWSVTVLGDSSDPRFEAVVEATQYWNRELEAVGVPLRFGSVSSSPRRAPEAELRYLRLRGLHRDRVERPRFLAGIRGNVVVAFSSSPDLRSVGIRPDLLGGQGLVVLRPADVLPLAAPNVARNVAAHELGHVLGLPHNSQPGTLMCMRTRGCGSGRYRADSVAFFPLTDAERERLRRRWRP